MQAIRRLVGMVLLLIPLGTGSASAQWWTAISYQPAAPLDNTKDFTDNFGWRGVGLDFKKQVKPALAVGLSFGWQVFDQQTDDVVSAFGLDISGDQFRYVNSFLCWRTSRISSGSNAGPGHISPPMSAPT